jgi:hypothetical protein
MGPSVHYLDADDALACGTKPLKWTRSAALVTCPVCLAVMRSRDARARARSLAEAPPSGVRSAPE